MFGKLSELRCKATLVANRGGESHEMEKNCGTNLSHSFPYFSNLLPGIGEQKKHQSVFLRVSMHDDVYFVCGKLSDLHFDTQLSPNHGETVL